MKFKLDENIHHGVTRALLAGGHDITTVHQQGLAGCPDQDIARAVKAEARCLITFDLDFADTRSFPSGEYSGLVVLRLRLRTAAAQLKRIEHVVDNSANLAGRLWIVEDDRVRDWTP